MAENHNQCDEFVHLWIFNELKMKNGKWKNGKMEMENGKILNLN